ncbi:ubiquitin fusion degradation protein 1 homolog [Sitodiplosis mosellana]|uniref:ubiquitin fusion degradation protein 1 homolog n=1 Tax=Sitodiplosis mosellana TaxID=263140 RepID=UPI0024439829|nr:ubiquitin fusion degradation protein 1 homolog [Sitodiplosis mosellana]
MFQFNGFNMMFPEARPFNNSYRCYSVSMLPGNERQDVEKGGKIIMPPSALDQLTRLNVVYPMLFKLTNSKKSRITHAGVLEFVADEGKIYIPYWMMHNLLLEEGDIVQIESVSLPVATFSKFKPQCPDFLEITNQKAVLENALRNFACLTTGDLIAIKYNSKIYELCVLETKPGNAVSIIECDMNVEFDTPVGYQEPKRIFKKKDDEDAEANEHMQNHYDNSQFIAFSGEGNRLDGKKKKCDKPEPPPGARTYVRGIPDYDHPYGLIRFDRSVKPISDRTESKSNGNDDDEGFKAFQGEGFSLRKSRK